MHNYGLPYGSPLYYGKVRGICRGFLYAYLWLSKGHYLPVKKSEVTF